MKPARPAVAVIPAAMAVAVMLAACGGQPASTSPSSPTSAAPTASPQSPPAQSPGSPSPSPSSRVVSFRLTYPWHWPNDPAMPGRVTHASAAPPVPELVRISVGTHPGAGGQPPYDRMAFTFNRAFPSYRFAFTSKLIGDASGAVIPLRGSGVLKIVFTLAQAHTADGTRSTIVSQPARNLGFPRMTDYAQAGDFEGVLTYGIGVTWPVPHANPQLPVRAYEAETITPAGQHQYVIAIDISAGRHA